MSNWKIAFVGDIFIHDNLDDSFLSSEVFNYLNKHDLKSCNFEAPIESDCDRPIAKAGPNLKQNSTASKWIQNAGFDVINLANNHIIDYGQEGLKATLDSFSEKIVVGAGLNFEEAYRLKVYETNGQKIGFLSFAEFGFGCLDQHNTNAGGYAWINHPIVNELVKTSKSNVDILLVQVHAGAEEVELPLPEWRNRYRELIDLGADAIIGHHPHVPQGWEIYKKKPIFYSLGNFYFDKLHNCTLFYCGYIVSLTYENGNLASYDVLPIKKVGHKVEANTNSETFEYLRYLCTLLDETEYLEKANSQALYLWEERYKQYYLDIFNGLTYRESWTQVLKKIIKWIINKKMSKYQELLLLHNLAIETHRWSVERALKYLNDTKNL